MEETLKAPNFGARAGQTIAGNLVRGADGQFASGGKPSTAKPRKGRVRKPKKPKLSAEERLSQRAAERQQKRTEVLSKFNIAPDGQDALSKLRNGEQVDPEVIKKHGFEEAGLVEQAADGTYRMTGAGRSVLQAADSGDAGRAGANISASRDRTAARNERRAAAEKRRQAREAKRGKSFVIYKQSNGQYRWIGLSSNAYRDREKEIVSTKALEADCVRADATGNYGPLRWWHVPGLDIGTCDFNAMSGRVLVESGTFYDPRIAQQVARKADQLQLSIGFTHPPGQPDADGVFSTIQRFERSLVPVGRAANTYTRFTVKETSMLAEKIKALKLLFGNDTELVDAVLGQAEATQKEADAAGVVFKAPPPFAAAPDEEKPVPPTDEKAPPVPGEEAPMGEEPLEEEPDTGAYVGDMAPEEFMAMLTNALSTAIAPLMEAVNIESKMRGAIDEMKAMVGGYATQKDDAIAKQQEQVDQLKQQITTQEAKLKELLGEQPTGAKGYRATQDAATITTDERLKALEPKADPFDGLFNFLTKPAT